MAISIIEFLGYAQFYKDGAPVFRLPVFSADGSPGMYIGAEFNTDLSTFNVTYTPVSDVVRFATNWADIHATYPPPVGTPSTSRIAGGASITSYVSYSNGEHLVFSKTGYDGNEEGSGSGTRSPNYPIIIKYETYAYQIGFVYENLVGGEMNNSTSTRNIQVDLDIFDEPMAEIEKLFVISPEGIHPRGPAGEIEGNPIDQGIYFNADRGESITFKFGALLSDGSVNQNIETEIYATYRDSGQEADTFTVSDYDTINISPTIRYSDLYTYGTLRGDTTNVNRDYEVAEIRLRIGNPAPPYTDIGGGSSGVSSGTSTPGGTFPSDPGPSIVGKIPNGAAGNDIAQSGLYTKYLINKTYMDLMGDILWEDNIVINALKELFGNPIDAIISCMSYPFNLVNLVNRRNQDLFFGHIDTNLPFIAITKSSFQIDWGEISIPFAWANFLDYSPYTKVELFLPWGPGYVTIDPNDVMPFSNTPGNFNVSTFTNGSIRVKTNIELDKGTCVHNVIGNNGRVIGAFSGIVGRNIPMTALDTGGKALATIGAVAAVATAGASTAATAANGGFNKIVHGGLSPINGGRGMAMKAYSVFDPSAAAKGFGSNVANSSAPNMASKAAFNTPPAFPRAGTFSDGSAAMSVQEPFLIISRPVQSVPTEYGHYNGYPSNIYYTNLRGVRGYTEISEIHLDNIGATTDELDELDSILKGGILL